MHGATQLHNQKALDQQGSASEQSTRRQNLHNPSGHPQNRILDPGSAIMRTLMPYDKLPV
ncbi:hypothetical protein N7519_009451 [Penicillium mononematosum]|uniref:uncharacterized protein n=1 Tax=Penicillium mononematosum TaxID=268346 RepID=UPI0025477BC9|nr:uncharacterized protein N7519_009451 [Penicillium mononematosum]KAJ6178990.1 hypothetical protein N7519_009451 [Penicillium mononematosum]